MGEFVKQLSPTLKMLVKRGDREKVYFTRSKFDDCTEKVNEITRGFLEMMLANTGVLTESFHSGDCDHTVISRRCHGYMRFSTDAYNNLQLWIRPVDKRNNFNMSRIEFTSFVSWRHLLLQYFGMVRNLNAIHISIFVFLLSYTENKKTKNKKTVYSL